MFKAVIVLSILLSPLNTFSQKLSKFQVIEYLNSISDKMFLENKKLQQKSYQYKFEIDTLNNIFIINTFQLTDTTKKEFRSDIFKLLKKKLPKLYFNEETFNRSINNNSSYRDQVINIFCELLMIDPPFKELVNYRLDGKILLKKYITKLDKLDEKTIVNMPISSTSNILHIQAEKDYWNNYFKFKKLEYDFNYVKIKEESTSEIWLLDESNSNFVFIWVDALKYLVSLAKAEENDKKVMFENPFSTNNLVKKNLIPLKKVGSLFYLECTIGKTIIDFIFDSGASDCTISENLFKSIQIHVPKENIEKLADGFYKIADGSIVTNERYLISGLKVGNFTYKKLLFSISKGDAPNLLGQSFLKLFRRWSIDSEENTLVLDN